jgi:hypothetical protein
MTSLRLAVVLGTCALAGAAVRATVILPVELDQLVTGARAVVHGRVVALEPRWVEGRRAIETLVTLEVDEYLKGDFGRDVTFRVPGGQMGPYRSVMIGAPRFREGDEVVVFLDAKGPTVPWISGLSQGVFRVATAGGVKMVLPNLSLTSGGAAPTVTRGDPGRQRVPFEAFAARVRTIVRDGRPQ